MSAAWAPPRAIEVAPRPGCSCAHCKPNGMTAQGYLRSRMILCPACGNKRCPHATFHGFACTGSNEPGQRGSDYA